MVFINLFIFYRGPSWKVSNKICDYVFGVVLVDVQYHHVNILWMYKRSNYGAQVRFRFSSDVLRFEDGKCLSNVCLCGCRFPEWCLRRGVRAEAPSAGLQELSLQNSRDFEGKSPSFKDEVDPT